MDALTLARLQFALTATFHFFLVPLTLGLSLLVALMETLYVAKGDELYLRMTRFWGKLFVINFAVGVVTGIVLEFQFGMNWAEYARFMGDIFGAPLAIEALLAFFLESTFLGVWIFGWQRVSKRVHLMSIWLVALGSNLSALWILIANSFMQEPVGYALRGGRVEMVDFWALLTNPHVWVQFPHVLAAAMATAAFFVLGISAYHLWKRSPRLEVFDRSFRWAAVYAVLATCLVIIIGHSQAQHMVKTQPMKMAAAEALWESQDPASFSLITIGNEPELRDVFAIRIPALLSILAYNQPEGEVKGIRNLQAEYAATYGPGNYIPPVAVSYWSFRLMAGAGFLMLAAALWALSRVPPGQDVGTHPLDAVLVVGHRLALSGQHHGLDVHRSGTPAMDRVWAPSDRRWGVQERDHRRGAGLAGRLHRDLSVALRSGRLSAGQVCPGWRRGGVSR